LLRGVSEGTVLPPFRLTPPDPPGWPAGSEGEHAHA
jgi:hypothetical protein